MEWWHVYLFTRLDSLNVVLALITMSIAFVVLLSLWAYFMEDYEDDTVASTLKGNMKMTIILFCISVLANVALPTQKEMAAIYLLPKLANTQELQQIPKDTAKLLRLQLDSWIEKLSSSEKQKTE